MTLPIDIAKHWKRREGSEVTLTWSLPDGRLAFKRNVKMWDIRSHEEFVDQCIDHTPDADPDEIGKHLAFLARCMDGPRSKGIYLLKNVSLIDVHCTLQEWNSSPYCGDVLEIAIATVLNAVRKEDALIWPIIIGSPSTGKTETVSGVRYEPTVYFLDSLTDRSFVTGFLNSDGSHPDDLLAELDGKCLLVKDLTPLFTGNEENTKAILGQMVAIYDGAYARFTGTRGKVEYESRFSYLACITPKAIQTHQRYIEQLGSRHLFYRIPSLSEQDEEEGMDMILENQGRGAKIKSYWKLCSSYIHDLLSSAPSVVKLTDTQKEDLKRMAKLLAKGRAISIRDSPDDLDIQNYQKEAPFRILSQLQSLVFNLARVHLREEVTDHEMELARRVVLSTIPLNRGGVLGLFQNPAILTAEGGLTVKQCAVGTGQSDKNAENLLKELVRLEILELDASRKAHQYRPLPEFASIITKPIAPLDHITDLTVGSGINAMDGLSKTVEPTEKSSESDQNDPSRTKLPIGQANFTKEGGQ